MKLNKLFKQALAVVGLALLIISCEDEFGSIGTDIVGQVNFETEVAQDFDIAAYSRNYADASGFNGVQTNGSQIGVVGYYNDPTYGSTTSNFLSQVALSRTNPDFGDNTVDNPTVIDSVVFSLAYFATNEGTDDDGASTYTIDSIFGNTPGQMKLSVYRSNFFLNSLDPNSDFEDAALYFSNEIGDFAGVEGDLLFEVRDVNSDGEMEEGFVPSAEELVLKEPVLDDDGNIPEDPEFEVSDRLSPRIRLSYDNTTTVGADVVAYWQEAIINQENTGVLLNSNTFNDYFRGLYFKAEAIDDKGSTILFNLTGVDVTIYYSFEGDDDSGEPGESTDDGKGDISLSLNGVRAIGYTNDFGISPIGTTTFNDSQNTVDGEENLYLKGGDGSIALIDLFGADADADGVADQLEALRSCNILINEANLTFYVDQEDLADTGAGQLEPERLFIYDYENNSTLLDAAIDVTTGAIGPVDTRVNHLGRLTRETEGDLDSDGVSYKIRVTQHINDIVQNDSTNVRLALAVSQNVTLENTALIGGTGDLEDGQRVPLSSVISPEGTILHGSASPDEEKRLRLRIFYTLTEEIDPTSPCGIALGL
ncbi:DUF4270 domain-containing protein [uncultured Dokdonia sp.]|uniref:DUF4270 domain-containing protein n=1 Tax=uncultured Dokdonia sp. TaxID=575653 RepID=UPI00261B0BC2|nr:DUF4270 domain-containing protein [uncultured Dokdonia sp.]